MEYALGIFISAIILKKYKKISIKNSFKKLLINNNNNNNSLINSLKYNIDYEINLINNSVKSNKNHSQKDINKEEVKNIINFESASSINKISIDNFDNEGGDSDCTLDYNIENESRKLL